jgi:hypothetical protein
VALLLIQVPEDPVARRVFWALTPGWGFHRVRV